MKLALRAFAATLLAAWLLPEHARFVAGLLAPGMAARLHSDQMRTEGRRFANDLREPRS